MMSSFFMDAQDLGPLSRLDLGTNSQVILQRCKKMFEWESPLKHFVFATGASWICVG